MKGKINSEACTDCSVFQFFWNIVFLRGFLFNLPNRECHDRIQN